MRGDLSATFAKGGRTETRRLDEDRRYTAATAATSPCAGAA
jgi:malate synthase